MPPFEDYVTLQQYDPANQATAIFGAIFTQSVQDILIIEPFAYVSAQDTIAKYNLNTLDRIAAVADSGVNKLVICDGKLVVSKQYPITTYFASVRDTSDLSLVTNIEGISGEAAGIVCAHDSLYMAVNGGWMGSDGKIAVIDPATWTLVREIQLGSDAVGIFNLYLYKDQLISVNKTPYGVPDLGSLTVYDPETGAFQNHLFGVTIGNGCGINDSLIYVVINNGIGSVNLNTMLIADSTIIPDPGSSLFTYITSAAVDTISDRLYVNVGDYFTPGYCLIASSSGDSLTSYATGISSEAIAIDYRENAAGFETGEQPAVNALVIYPNPADEFIRIRFQKQLATCRLIVTDLAGRTLIQHEINAPAGITERINIRHLSSGVYLLVVEHAEGNAVSRFIKR